MSARPVENARDNSIKFIITWLLNFMVACLMSSVSVFFISSLLSCIGLVADLFSDHDFLLEIFGVNTKTRIPMSTCMLLFYDIIHSTFPDIH